MENYNKQTEQQAPQQNNPEPTDEPNRCGGNNGCMFKLASIVIILCIILLGGLYLWGYMGDKDMKRGDAKLINDIYGDSDSALDEVVENVEDSISDQLSEQSASDEIADIEADLNNSNLGDVNLDDLGF